MRKDLRDSLILLQILGKVSQSSYSQMVSQSLGFLFDSLLNNGKNGEKGGEGGSMEFNFQEWKNNKSMNISTEMCH